MRNFKIENEDKKVVFKVINKILNDTTLLNEIIRNEMNSVFYELKIGLIDIIEYIYKLVFYLI